MPTGKPWALFALMVGLATGCSRADERWQAADDAAVWRILPLGDSITQGNRQNNSYRRPLWLRLQEEGCAVSFVGGQTRNYFGGPPDQDFHPRHEGHWGWRVDEVRDHLPGWLDAYPPPDAALIHLGSNDLFRGKPIPEIVDQLGQVVDLLRARNPDMVVFVAKIIPARGMEADMAALNREVERLAAMSTERSPVVIVDQEAGFDAGSMTYDGTHPNPQGEEKIAATWYAALKPFLVRACSEKYGNNLE